jgi:hypothetical protein
MTPPDKALDRWNGNSCKEAAASVRVIETPDQWHELWGRSIGSTPPPADFQKQFAVAVFLGAKPTGGFTVELLGLEDRANETVVRYCVNGPPNGRAVVQAFTQPYAIRLYKKTGLKVSVSRLP